MDSLEHDASNTPMPYPLREESLAAVEAAEHTEQVGSITVDEAISVNGISGTQEASERARPFIVPKSTPPGLHLTDKTTEPPSPTLSKREQWIMDVVRDPKVFKDTVLGFYIRGEFGFDKLPRKEILRLFHRHSYKRLTPDVSDALKQGLDDLVFDGVLIKKTYPSRTKKIRDTVYLHLSPTIEDELRELAATQTEDSNSTVAETIQPVTYSWDEDNQAEIAPEDSEESYDEAFERMLGPFKSSTNVKPRERGRRDERRRR